jgi:hypothetical protein
VKPSLVAPYIQHISALSLMYCTMQEGRLLAHCFHEYCPRCQLPCQTINMPALRLWHIRCSSSLLALHCWHCVHVLLRCVMGAKVLLRPLPYMYTTCKLPGD